MDLIWFLNCPSFYQKVINLPFTITSLGSGGRWGGWSEIQLLDSLRVGTAKVTDQTDTDRHMLSKDQGESGSRAEVWPQPRCAGAQRPGSCGALCYKPLRRPGALSLNKWLPAFSVPLQLWSSGAQLTDKVSIQGTLLPCSWYPGPSRCMDSEGLGSRLRSHFFLSP